MDGRDVTSAVTVTFDGIFFLVRALGGNALYARSRCLGIGQFLGLG